MAFLLGMLIGAALALIVSELILFQIVNHSENACNKHTDTVVIDLSGRRLK